MKEQEDKEMFVTAVRNNPDIPEEIKSNADSVVDLVKAICSKTYFELLDEQIETCPKGPEWQEILKSRRAALKNYCGKSLLRGLIQHDGKNVNIRVNPKNQIVVHWEVLEKKHPGKRM